LLIAAGIANAAINVSTASNTEIASFIENESNKILQIPDYATLKLDFQTAQDEHSRAGILFFWGEREVSIKATYILSQSNLDTLKGTVKADSSWFTGYCGMIECKTKPMPAQQRIEVLKVLVSRLLAKLNGKFQGAFVTPSSASQTPITPALDEAPAAESSEVSSEEPAEGI